MRLKNIALSVGGFILGSTLTGCSINYIRLNNYQKNAEQELAQVRKNCDTYNKKHEGEPWPEVAATVENGVVKMHPLFYCSTETRELEEEIWNYKRAKYNPLKLTKDYAYRHRLKTDGRREILMLPE